MSLDKATFENTLSKNENELKIFEKHPHIIENPEILRSVLLPIELFALQQLLKENRPLSTNDVHARAIRKIYTDSEKDAPRGAHDYSRSITPDLLLWVKSELKKKKLKYPSFDKILNVLSSLESWGFLTKRPDEYGKASFFWVLHPALKIESRKKLLEALMPEAELVW